ncbi:MAG: DEAD/DEAH box helicase [Planctomycetes bacterium]|nr:DEAD/DEAH box helicase [Planctomycetota bacterium]
MTDGGGPERIERARIEDDRRAPISVGSIDLRIPVADFSTGWNTALARGWRIQALPVEMGREASVRIITVRVVGPAPPCESFLFPESARFVPMGKRPARGPAPDRSRPIAPPVRHTRIRPPNDIIKLKDRLYYMLQPPLESLVQTGEVHFPFEPFPYQLEGIAFLYPRVAAVLADEMGLGKTMQSITAVRLLLRSGEIRSVLLVCPKPLVSNWRREFALWAPEIPLAIIEGEREKRHWQWRQPAMPVKIANYELLMRDRDLLNEGGLRFDLVLLDEAQRIKNRSSATSEIVRAIPRSRGWALTGTPVENSPDDLVGIFEFLAPGCLQSGMEARRMGRLARDYVLRRTKDMVLTDLPPKIYRDAHLALTPEQWETYRIAEDEGVVRLSAMGDELTIQHVFELVLRLKQICNFDPATGASCKLERLVADLEEIAACGQKAIVFSQWVESLRTIRDRISAFGPLEYHGRIPSRQRDAILEQFKQGDAHHVLLMSYGAGSVGINLQFCQYVFLFDRWWNPAVEDQAINRAHRIGSAGPVVVTRMLATETIEQRINQVLEDKRELFATIFAESGPPSGSGLTQDEIFGLFRLKTPNGPLKRTA